MNAGAEDQETGTPADPNMPERHLRAPAYATRRECPDDSQPTVMSMTEHGLLRVVWCACDHSGVGTPPHGRALYLTTSIVVEDSAV